MTATALASADPSPQRRGRAVIGPAHVAAIVPVSLFFLATHSFFLAAKFAGMRDFVGVRVPPVVVSAAVFVVAVALADERIRAGANRVAAYGAAAVGAAVVGAVATWLLTAALGGEAWVGPSPPPSPKLSIIPFRAVYSLIQCALLVAIYARWRDGRDAARALERYQLRQADALRRVRETRLQALQARVDPAFLFDTLSRIAALQGEAPVHADRMLDDLIRFLRALTPAADDGPATVERELALAAAFVRVAGARAEADAGSGGGAGAGGDAFTIDIAARARHARMPPMLVLPLLRAAHRRWQALPRLRVHADVVGSRLRIALFASGPCATRSLDGLDAVDDVRHRLAELGADAELVLAPDASRPEDGQRFATLLLPWDDGEGEHRDVAPSSSFTRSSFAALHADRADR